MAYLLHPTPRNLQVMNKRTMWLLLAVSVTGVIVYLARKKVQHRKWVKKRAEILAKARRKDHGEFVL